MVERHLAKVEVAGSSPVIRSKEKTLGRVSFLFFGAVRGVSPAKYLSEVLRVLSRAFASRRPALLSES